jgi:hypothetical protein
VRKIGIVRPKTEPDAISFVSGEDMKMHVKHFLSGDFPVRQEEVDALGTVS